MRVDEHTKAYVAKKTAEGHSKLEIIRCLKRLIAREVYYLLRPAELLTRTAGPHHGRFLHDQPTAGAQPRSTGRINPRRATKA